MIFFNYLIYNSLSILKINLNEILNIIPSNYLILNDSIYFINFGEYEIRSSKSIKIEVHLWGAGGGGFNGGLGGYSNGTIILEENIKYIIWVGQGGISRNNGSFGVFGGGGLIGTTNNNGVYVGTGGGLSGMFINNVNHSNSIIIAGGGGGGLIYPPSDHAFGGNGGGTNGTSGIYNLQPGGVGKGGTQTNGGERGNLWNYGSTAGSELQGGIGASSITQTYSGGSGGGGYYGGGGGSNNNWAGGPGGGGSGFINLKFVTNGNTTFFLKNNIYINNVGNYSQNGLFVIKFSKLIILNSPKKNFYLNFLFSLVQFI